MKNPDLTGSNEDEFYERKTGDPTNPISEKLLSITQVAKYRKIPTERLRYYDRIGILQPDYVDPLTGRRFYSAEQCEKLGTIKELRKMNLSLQEISEYFNNRNLEKSQRILQKRYELLEEEIKEKLEISRVLAQKLEFIRKIGDMDFKLDTPQIKQLDERYALKGKRNKFRTGSTGIEFMKLEETIGGTSPVVATNKVAMTISNSVLENAIDNSVCPIIFCTKEESKRSSFTTLPAGKYVCAYHRNCYSYLGEIIMKMRYFAEDNGCKLCDEGLMIYQLDITLTDIHDETIIEIQFPLLPQGEENNKTEEIL